MHFENAFPVYSAVQPGEETPPPQGKISQCLYVATYTDVNFTSLSSVVIE